MAGTRSKYKGGFKNGKNTSAYNHDYYIHNKNKWKDTEEEDNNGWVDNQTERSDDPNITYQDIHDISYKEYNDDGTATVHTPVNEYSVYTEAHGLHSRKRNPTGKPNAPKPGDMTVHDFVNTYGKSAKVHKRGDGLGGKPQVNYPNRPEQNFPDTHGLHSRKRKDSGKTAEVHKRGEGLGGKPQAEYQNRIPKRRAGRKAIGYRVRKKKHDQAIGK